MTTIVQHLNIKLKHLYTEDPSNKEVAYYTKNEMSTSEEDDKTLIFSKGIYISLDRKTILDYEITHSTPTIIFKKISSENVARSISKLNDIILEGHCEKLQSNITD